MDAKKSNSNNNIKATMDFFKQKRDKENKKAFSSLDVNKDNISKSTTIPNFHSTIQGIYKSDLFQIDSYMDQIKSILANFSQTRENLLLYKKDFNSKINSIKENINKDTKDQMATNRINSLNIDFLLKEYKCNDKESLINEISYENFTLKLLLNKLDDLFFLFNIKLFDSKFSKNYSNNENNSIINNIKYLSEFIIKDDFLNLNLSKFKQTSINISQLESLEKGLLPLAQMNSKSTINEVDESKEENDINITKKTNTKNLVTSSDIKSLDGPSISYEMKEIPVEIVMDLNEQMEKMTKFGDFLNLTYENDEFFKKIFDKIRELFYIYNKNMFDPIMDLINNKLNVKSDLSNKVQIVLKNEVNECYENPILIRKILEDNFSENQNKIEQLNKVIKDLEKKYNELEVNFNKNKKTLEEIGNRDYSLYYKEMKASNDIFLREFEKIEKQRNEKLYEQYETQLEKNKELKKEIKELKNEIFALKMKIDNFNVTKDKTGDDYINALKEQFEDAQESFQEQISNITDEYYKKRKEIQQKCKALEDENKHLKGIQNAIIKKLDKMESLFSK